MSKPNVDSIASLRDSLAGLSQPVLGRFDSKTRPNLDLLPGTLTLFLIAAYIIYFGIIHTHGAITTSFSWSYATILLPIWLIDGVRAFAESFLPTQFKFSGEDLSKVTVVIACKDGSSVIPKTLRSLTSRFDPGNIILVSNGSTDNTVAMATRFGVRVFDIPEAIGKVRAINYGLEFVKTPYVLLLDDDTLVGKTTIPTALLDEGYDGVAFRVLVKKSTWVTEFQAYEYRKSADIGKRSSNRSATVQNISGAIGLFKLTELKRQITLHSGEFSGEDLQRTLLIHQAARGKGVVLVGAAVYTLPPKTIRELFKQRVFGWYPGLYSNFPNYIRLLFKKDAPSALRTDAFYNAFLIMGLDPLRLLSLPVLLFYPWYFVILYGVYILLEIPPYIRTRKREPFWVILGYPLYGLFGFVTRICAFSVLIYRRTTAALTHSLYPDDYRLARQPTKAFSVGATLLLTEIILQAGDHLHLARLITSIFRI